MTEVPVILGPDAKAILAELRANPDLYRQVAMHLEGVKLLKLLHAADKNLTIKIVEEGGGGTRYAYELRQQDAAS
jgi:hypothetical protein